MKTHDLHWAAGFLEGEGYFSCGGKKRTSPTVAASQVNAEPLVKLRDILGGVIQGPYQSQHAKGSPFVRWYVGGSRAVGVMMTLYALLSEKRRMAIRKALQTWRSAPGGSQLWAASGVCKNGHTLTGDNYIVATSGHGRCRECGIQSRRRYYRENKEKWPYYRLRAEQIH